MLTMNKRIAYKRISAAKRINKATGRCLFAVNVPARYITRHNRRIAQRRGVELPELVSSVTFVVHGDRFVCSGDRTEITVRG